jgi:predicted DNA-binding transcriptional regulator YafY
MKASLDILQSSISNFLVIFIKYKNAQNILSEREIEPLALYFEQNEWKLIAHCRLRKENREFLVSRIDSLAETHEVFAPNQFTLEFYFKNK